MARLLIHEHMHPRLVAALQPLEALIDWERRDRSVGAGMRVDVGPSRDLYERLGRPLDSARVIHVTGTKGKGSTVALLAAALRAAGFRVGAYLSPHVERVNERVRIDGRSIDDERLADALVRATHALELARAASSAARDATWFDVFTNAGFLALREAGVEWAVVEVGIGGRLDSTNVLATEAAVITNISLEHTSMLGATRSAIAREKAGILRARAVAVTGVAPGAAPWRDAAGAVIEAEAQRLGCELLRPDWSYVREHGASDTGADTNTETSGWVSAGVGLTHARRNAELAGLVLDALGARGACANDARAGDARASDLRTSDASSARHGARALGAWLLDERTCESARLPARAELFAHGTRHVVVDGAHVPASLSSLLDDLGALAGKPVVVIGVGRDKDAHGLLKALVGRVDRVLCTSVGEGPYLPAAELARVAGALALSAETVASPREALERALTIAPRGGWVLVTGSLHLAGVVRPLLSRVPPC